MSDAGYLAARAAALLKIGLERDLNRGSDAGVRMLAEGRIGEEDFLRRRARGEEGGIAAPGASEAPETRVCRRTGLLLVPAAGRPVWRVSRARYGPLEAQAGPVPGDQPGWRRLDVPGERTLYAASSPTTALAHVLPLSPPTGGTAVARGWPAQHVLWQIRLPAAGWFVDVDARATQDALRQAAGRGSSDDIDLPAGAAWIHDQVLDDGTAPLGLRSASRYQRDEHMWWIWLGAMQGPEKLAVDGPATAISLGLVERAQALAGRHGA